MALLAGFSGLVIPGCAEAPHSEPEPDSDSGTGTESESESGSESESTAETSGEPHADTSSDVTVKPDGGGANNSTSPEDDTSSSSKPDAGTSTPAGGDGELAGSGATGAAPASGPTLGAPVAGGDGVSAVSGSAVPEGEPDVGWIGDGGVLVEPGTLTAGTWDDNLNFSLFLDYWEGLQQSPVAQDGYLDFSQAEHETAFEQAELVSHQKLDVALVIDTTGSMSDELQYLQAEFLSISERIEAAYPNAEQRWSLVVYKDETDEYVTRWFDFRDSAEEFRTHLAAQSAGGGGDFPEASHAALASMNQLSWRDDSNTARVAFWVADAPHHAAHAAEMKSAIEDAQGQSIHLYPVASSGVDEMTELSMRSAAQLTGGRYLFLTDDSGVGNSHKEPTIPCYFVTPLDEALLRVVEVEMTGTRIEPDAPTIIRAVGDPQQGVCATTADAGPQVRVF